MQKKNEFKLPQIKKTHKQSAIQLSKTISDSKQTPKLRPASSNKVQDLQKKLFNKLEAYDHGSKKKLTKKISKIGKQSSAQFTSVNEGTQGYQRMQKLMPGLYTKLIQTKRGNYMSENLISQLQLPNSQKNIATPIRQESNQMSKIMAKNQQKTIDVVAQEEELYSQEEMDKIFKQYELLQGLPIQTTNKEMKQLSQSILCCQSSIESIRKSMQGLIHQIGMQYINQIQKDQQLDFSN